MTDPRSANEILASFLLTLQGEFSAIDQRVVTAPRTPLNVLGVALSLELESAEYMADAARKEAFPDTASAAGVLKHAEMSSLTPTTAAHAVLRVRLTGTPSSLLTIPAGKTLTDPQGLVFNATAGVVTTQSDGTAFTTVTARDAGTSGNLTLGTVLTWQNGAPTGMAATVVTALAPGDETHALIAGADAEGIEDLRARAVLFRKAKAQAGTRADWAANVEAVEGVGDAFVYPRMAVTGAGLIPGRPGTLLVIPLAPSPADASYVQNADGSLGTGLDPLYFRSPSSELLARVRAYIEGTQDAAGRPVPSPLQVQLHSAGIGTESYTVQAPGLQIVDVTIALAADPAIAPWPWGVTSPPFRTVQASPAPTTTTFTLDIVTGILPLSRLAVNLTVPGPAVTPIRGGYWLATVQSVVGNLVTLTAPLPAAPLAGNDVRPDGGLWVDVRRLTLGIFDHLGTGDEPLVRSQRFPRPGDHAPDRLYMSRIIDALQELPGVSGVSVQLPATSYVTPPTGDLIIPGFVRIVPQV